MDQPLPVIYARQLEPQRLSALERLLALGISLGCLSVLLIAAKLEPSPTGIGTHTHMGLNECQFERRTGLPCPTCGMTTSYAHFFRGNLVASAYVQPMGMVLALLTAVSLWGALYIALSGRPVQRLLRVWPAQYYLSILFALVILGWVWKMYLHLSGRDGWG